jgi:hypothetical protein
MTQDGQAALSGHFEKPVGATAGKAPALNALSRTQHGLRPSTVVKQEWLSILYYLYYYLISALNTTRKRKASLQEQSMGHA